MAEFKVVFLVLLSVCSFAKFVQGKCPDCFVRVGGRCVKVLTDQMIADDAFDQCAKFEANLTAIDTKDYYDKLGSFLTEHYNDVCFSPTRKEISYWTAGRRDGSTTNFYWGRSAACQNKTKIIFPSGVGAYLSNSNNNEDCLEFVSNKGKFEINDLPCNNKKIANSAHKLCAICQTD